MKNQEKFLTRRKMLIAGVGLAALGTTNMVSSQRTSVFAAESTTVKKTKSSLPIKAIEAVFGVKGTVESTGVLVFDLPRTDIHPALFGVPIKPDAGFDTEITFQAINSGAIVKWEFCLLDEEVNPVIDAMSAQALQPPKAKINAFHNHFLKAQPEVKFLHGTAIGDAVQIARALRQALKHSHQPFQSSAPGHTGLPDKEITRIIGGTSMISGSVLTVSVDRKDRFHEFGVLLQPEMQVNSSINFQSIGGNKAAAIAEIPVLPQEADVVTRIFRQHGIFVTALHNHELFIEPDLYYIHAFGTGSPLALAQAERAVLNHVNSQFAS